MAEDKPRSGDEVAAFLTDHNLGSLDGGMQDPADAPPSAPTFVPEAPQPINQATMMCLRGPCEHFWQLVLRFPSAVKDTMRERCWTCTASGYEDFELNEKLIYFCDRWWPRAPLEDDHGKLLVDPDLFEEPALSPKAARARARPQLHAAWEDALARTLGYDFSWRDFDPEANPDDSPEQRGRSAPGDLETMDEAAQREHEADLPPAGSIPEDDDDA